MFSLYTFIIAIARCLERNCRTYETFLFPFFLPRTGYGDSRFYLRCLVSICKPIPKTPFIQFPIHNYREFSEIGVVHVKGSQCFNFFNYVFVKKSSYSLLVFAGFY